jgi:hypothetical protein
MERLIADKHLELVTGAEANGIPLLEKAHRTVATAAEIGTGDPYSSYVLAYDAARAASTALLAQQGLRPTTKGGHYAVEHAVRSQFGPGFRPFGTLRRRRNELEYPHLAEDNASTDEAAEAVQSAERLIAAADQLLPRLSFFGK